MNYFLDTEFIEGFKKPIKWLPTIGNFNKPYHSIQLISIGIVGEDGREYYAISNEYNYNDASDWVRQNVILPMYRELVDPQLRRQTKLNEFHNIAGKSIRQIANEIVEFIYGESDDLGGLSALELSRKYEISDKSKNPEFYGYYADYDWVVFCSLFGTMMDLPKGFPMYCRDLKQMFDEAQEIENHPDRQPIGFPDLKSHDKYPKQANEHNALDDAKWNSELFKFLKNLSAK